MRGTIAPFSKDAPNFDPRGSHLLFIAIVVNVHIQKHLQAEIEIEDEILRPLWMSCVGDWFRLANDGGFFLTSSGWCELCDYGEGRTFGLKH